MKLGIRLHLAGLSLSNTISIIDNLGVERCRSTVHNWLQTAELQPTDGANPDHVTVDETVSQLHDERFWLYAAVDPATNRSLHMKLSPTRNQAITEMFLAELKEKHLVGDASLLVDSAPWLQAAFHRHGLDYRYEKLDSEASPNHVALDETVIRINDQQYWLYAAVDPEMNNFSTFGSLRPIRLVLPKSF